MTDDQLSPMEQLMEQDKKANKLSRDYFSQFESPTKSHIIMMYALVNLCLEKELFSDLEFKKSVDDAAYFLKIMEKRKELQDDA